nr:hypothetical protein [Tanacetum cinerariifolium]
MACSLSHTDDEVEALVQKLIDEDMVRQKAILDSTLQFDNACVGLWLPTTVRSTSVAVGRHRSEEQAMDEKAREEKIMQKQAEADEFFWEFRVVRYDSDDDSSD